MNPEPKRTEPKRTEGHKNVDIKPREKKYDAVANELEKMRKSKAFRELGDMLYID